LRYQRNLYITEKYILGYNFVAGNTSLSSFVNLLLPPKYEKYGEIPIEFDLTAVQGHPRSSIWCQWKAHMWLGVSNCNFSRICYHFRDIHAWR